jgi:hypothetical protein
MKRFDLVFVLSLGLLAFFVGHEALAERQRGMQRTISFGATPITDVRAAGGEAARTTVRSRLVSGLRGTSDVADVRRRLELSSPGTYIGEVLAARDSSIARWPDRRSNPLRVWVQPSALIRDFTPEFVPIVRNAFSEWREAGVPIAFTFVFDSTLADVRVTWLDHFKESISGKTLWAHDDSWWIVDAQIMLAVHHRSGEVLDTSAMRAISLHEVGHLIGLDHTVDTTAIMTPKVRVKELSAADRATAQLLYLLPPGRIGASQR